MSSFLLVDRDLRTPGHLLARNEHPNETWNLAIHTALPSDPSGGFASPAGSSKDNGFTPPVVHVTQKGTGVAITLSQGERGACFSLAPNDELWIAASRPVVAWVTTDW